MLLKGVLYKYQIRRNVLMTVHFSFPNSPYLKKICDHTVNNILYFIIFAIMGIVDLKYKKHQLNYAINLSLRYNVIKKYTQQIDDSK